MEALEALRIVYLARARDMIERGWIWEQAHETALESLAAGIRPDDATMATMAANIQSATSDGAKGAIAWGRITAR